MKEKKSLCRQARTMRGPGQTNGVLALLTPVCLLGAVGALSLRLGTKGVEEVPQCRVHVGPGGAHEHGGLPAHLPPP